jgi:serine/threonine-protein kinase
VARGSKVSLSVSAGPDTVEVPDLEGFTEDEAKARLATIDLAVGSTKLVDDTGQDKGRVASTTPEAGESVAVGSKVVLNVSSGLITMPDVLGLSRSVAAQKLSDAGFRIKTVYAESTQPEDTVLKQSLKEGAKVDDGTQVTLTVAQAPAPTPTTTTTTTAPPTSTTTTTAPPTGTGTTTTSGP